MNLSRSAHVTLAMLSHSAVSAYELRLELQRRLAFIWNESPGQLYPAVKQLLAEGLATESGPPGPRGARRLSVTDLGRRAIQHWLTTPPQPDTPRDELVARVALLKEKPPQHLLLQLDAELQRAQAIADSERTLMTPVDRHLLNVTSVAARRLARRWVILFNDARATWCREVLVQLRELVHPELNPLCIDPASLDESAEQLRLR